MKVIVTGIKEALQKAGKKLSNKLPDLVMKGLNEAGNAVISIAMGNTPVRTGNLQRNYIKQPSPPYTLYLLNRAPYWKFVEYGTGIYNYFGTGRQTPWCYYLDFGGFKGFVWTKGQRPKLMLTNAVSNNKPLINQIVKNAIYKGIGK